MSAASVQLPKSFNWDLPEIYQIEVTNACQLRCPMCLRTTKMTREIGYLDLRLLEKMIRRGDLDNSYFVELQFYGEPLLHRDLGKIITLLKDCGVAVGLSTNGVLLKEKLEDVLKLDALTVSLDSLDPEIYSRIRVGSSLSKVIEGIEALLQTPKRPLVDLQVIELPELVNGYKQVAEKYSNIDGVLVRSVPDCFLVARGDTSCYIPHELCFNPWMSVSVCWNGDVVPCCFDMNASVIYGNLNRSPLKSIWASETVEEMRFRQLRNNLYDVCSKCYMKSPVLLHMQFLMNWWKRRAR